MLRVGITGNIGSGKTTVCRIMEALGVPVIYADQVGRDMLDEDEHLRDDIIQLLGKASYHGHKADRKFIADRVFSDPSRLKALNELIHPRVHEKVRAWFETLQGEWPYAVEEAALLIESGGFRYLDKLVLVAAPESTRMERVMKRDGANADQVEARMRHQMKEEHKRLFCDFVIENDGSSLLLPQVWRIHQILSRS